MYIYTYFIKVNNLSTLININKYIEVFLTKLLKILLHCNKTNETFNNFVIYTLLINFYNM